MVIGYGCSCWCHTKTEYGVDDDFFMDCAPNADSCDYLCIGMLGISVNRCSEKCNVASDHFNVVYPEALRWVKSNGKKDL